MGVRIKVDRESPSPAADGLCAPETGAPEPARKPAPEPAPAPVQAIASQTYERKGLVLTVVRQKKGVTLVAPVDSYGHGWDLLYDYVQKNWNSAGLPGKISTLKFFAIKQYFEAKKEDETYFMDYVEFCKWAVV